MDKIFNKPFAVNGARVAIPENGTENERVSFDKGFTQPYEVEAPSVDNPAGQGFNILRPEMNEALYQLSNACNILAENIDKWIPLTNENLNNITTAGRYYQQNTEIGFIALNYPAEKLGFLIVLRQNPNIQYITQIYKTMAENIFYVRCSSDGGNSWEAWDSIGLNSELYTKSQIDTKLSQKEDILPAIGWTATGTAPSFRFIAGYSNITASATILTSNIPCDGTAITATFQLKHGTATQTKTQTIANPAITGNPAMPRVILVNISWNIGASSSDRVINCAISLNRGSVAASSVTLSQTARQ